jgi:hypothetical protein
MDEYVKICPTCKHVNNEDSDICEKDGVYLGMTPSVRLKDVLQQTQQMPSSPPPVSESPKDTSAPLATASPISSKGEPEAPPPQDTSRYVEAPSVIYLELLGTSKVYTVRQGSVLGQAHPESDTEIQLEGYPGVNFIHRRHCQFDVDNGQWVVIPIDQVPFGRDFTNPSYLNQEKLVPGKKYPINNGDRLVLGKVPLSIRIV